MQYILSKRFEKSFKKLPPATKKKVLVVLELFVVDPTNPKLRCHRLSGQWHNHYSLDVTGDMRAVYIYIEKDIVHFVALGTHSELYG